MIGDRLLQGALGVVGLMGALLIVRVGLRVRGRYPSLGWAFAAGLMTGGGLSDLVVAVIAPDSVWAPWPTVGCYFAATVVMWLWSRPARHVLRKERELAVLEYLVTQGPANGYEISKATGVSGGTLYPMLDRLERTGSVVRTRAAGGAIYSVAGDPRR